MATKCPNCSAALLPSELAEGWCESCGKKLPASRTPERSRSERPGAMPLATDSPKPGFLHNIGCFLGLVGLGLIVFGYSEFRLAIRESGSPASFRLEDLEAGAKPSQNHVLLGRHVRLYSLAVYRAKAKEIGDPKARLDYVLVPIFSPEHPFYKEWSKQREEGNVRLDKLRVVLRTTRHATLADIPAWTVEEPSLEGMVVNDIQSLGKDEIALLREEFPGANFEDVLLIEEGRRPTSLLVSACCLVGGTLLAGLAIRQWWSQARGPQPHAD